MSAVTLRSRVRRHPDTLSRTLEGEAILLGGTVAEYFGLDPVGTRIWELLDEHDTLEGVLRAIVREYDVDAGRAERDLLALVGDLARSGLVEVDPVEADPAR